MSTVRLQIVDAIAEALGLACGLPTYRNLDFALDENKLPALAIVSGDDAPDEFSPLGMLDQQVTIEITALVAASSNPEADVDDTEAKVHAALSGAVTFGGHAVDVKRVGGAWSFNLGDCAARHLTYRVGYRSTFTNLEA